MSDLRAGERLLRVDVIDDESASGRQKHYFFAVDGSVPEGAEKTAVQQAGYTYYNANPPEEGTFVEWCDAMSGVPDEHWALFGLRPLPLPRPTCRIEIEGRELVADGE